MYRLVEPAPALRAYIESYWTVDGPTELQVDVFVDGRADLILNFGAPYLRVRGSEAVEHHASNLDAQRRYPIRIIQRGDVSCVGVRFRAGGVTAFTRRPMAELTDRTVPVEEVFPGLDPDRLDEYFLARLRPPDPRFQQLLGQLHESSGVEAACAQVGLSVRTADRLFARHLGLSPKLMARIERFQRSLQRLMRDPGVTLAEVAAACGYYDQPHFVKEFRHFSGGVPREHRGYFPAEGPADFAPNVVRFLQDEEAVKPYAASHGKRRNEGQPLAAEDPSWDGRV